MCNGHGTCESKNGAAICTCTSFYYGTYCEHETSTVTQSEQIKKAATAFTVVGIVYYGTYCEHETSTVTQSEQIKKAATAFTVVGIVTIYSIGIVFDVLRFGFSVV